ncbi:hypothetical protein [Phaeobacter inhibens]|uniref:hypothetical protein n=1 Tax=Phaeobacter inhibens TaxID=221822 RepID=UPI0020C7F86F|nr:hypothetical protein [Phaeobacter inhibens]
MTGERAAQGIPAELQDEAICVYNLLGGDKVMKRPFRSALDAHDLIVEGLPSKSLLFLVKNVQVLSTGDVLKRAAGISLRAIQWS